MRLTLRTLTLLLLATGGGATAVAQDSVPSHEAGTNPRFIEESDLPDSSPHYPTLAQLGLRYGAVVKQADSWTISDPAQSGSSKPTPGDTSYLTIDAPSAIAAREAAEAASTNGGVVAAPRSKDLKLQSEFQRNTDCENGTLHGKPCRVSWWRVLSQSFFFLSTQHLGNIGLDHDTRAALERGNFWGNYAYCVEHYRWWRWKDDDPFLVDYVGHPMMGAVTSSIYEQNDPKQRALMFENTQRYWMGRLRAMAYSAAYSAQWKVGPLSEASIGSTGLFYYTRARDGIWTNETGMQDFFITPIGGMAWNVGEDVIDRYILRHVRHARRNKWVLLASSLMTPGKSAANVTRFRATYYRDLDLETSGALAR
jgi:hypothetical protein